MKQLLRNLCMFASVLGVVAIMGGCSSSDTSKDVEYTQTHQNDDVTNIKAKMYQKYGNKDRMGEIKFAETDSGLKMTVDLKDVRPNTEYNVYVYELKGCDMKKEKKDMRGMCEKTKQDIDLPMLKGDMNGKIATTYMIRGITAADLDNKKIVLSRENDSGEEVHVGWGMLKEGMMF